MADILTIRRRATIITFSEPSEAGIVLHGTEVKRSGRAEARSGMRLGGR